jgi:hypothetical protein
MFQLRTRRILATVVCAVIIILLAMQSMNRLGNVPHYLTVIMRVEMDVFPDGQSWGAIDEYSLNLSRTVIDQYDNVSLSKMFPTNITGASGNLIIEIVVNRTGAPGFLWSHTIGTTHNQAGTYQGVVAQTFDLKGRVMLSIVLYAHYSGRRDLLERISEWLWLS